VKLLRRCLIALCAGAVALGVLPAPAAADAPPLDIGKFFDDLAIPIGGTTTLNIDITNTTTEIDFEDVSFNDTLPDGLAFLPETATTTCGGELGVLGQGLIVEGIDLPAGESCSTFVTVVGLEVGVYENTASAIPGNDTASATLTVVGPPTISKEFASPTAPVGGTTRLTFTLTNPNETTDLTGVSAFDNLDFKLDIADDPAVTNTCLGNVDLTPGPGLIELSGGAIDQGESCEFSLDVKLLGSGLINNTVGAWADESGGHPDDGGAFSEANASITGLAAPLIVKTFSANAIDVGGTTSLTLNVHNQNGIALTGVGYSDTLPAGLSFANPVTESRCGGTLTRTSTAITLSGATVAPEGDCSIESTVTATTLGLKHNVTSAVTSANGGTGNTASDDLLVAPPPSVTKTFAAPTMALNGTVGMTFSFSNPNNFAVTGLFLSDTLPSGLVVATPPNASNTCGATFTPTAGGSNLLLHSGTIAANGSCTATVDVTANSPGGKTNTTGNVSSTNAGVGNTGTDSITVIGPPGISKTFGSLQVAVGGTTSLTFNIANANPSDPLSGVGFTDTLPSGLVVASPNGVSGSCGGGTISAVPGTGTISLSNATLAANTSCSFSVNVRGATPGAQNNSVTATSTEGGTSSAALASITVVGPPVLGKSFADPVIPVGTSTALTFTVENPNPSHFLTQVGFSDTLPAGLVVATPNGLSGSCGGGTISAVAGSGTISLVGGDLDPGASCSFSVSVQGVTAGVKDNTTGAVSSLEGGPGSAASASLVVASPPSMTKAFGVSSVALGVPTSLTFSLSNPNSTTALSGVAFTDNLPAGLVVASPNGATNGCGGSVTAVAGSGSVSLAGGSIPSSGSCTVKVDVVGTSAGQKVNTSGAVSSTTGGTGNTASANVVVVAPPAIAKAFGKSVFPIGSTTSLTFTVSNPNVATTLTGVGFSDSLPAGLVVNTPSGLSNGCGGSASAAAGTVSLSGGSIPPLGSCTVTVSVKGVGAGTKNNVSGAVTSTEGGTGNTASASVIVALPPSLTKAFGAGSVRVGQTTSLTFTITNPNTGTPLSGVTFSDPFPSGLMVAASPSVSNTCGGVPTVGPFALAVGYGSGTIPAGGSCTFKVNVTATSTGVKNNVTTIISSTQGGVGSPASASVTVTP
jgi:uncharacterized repeat protein (TIGR01451 family)